MDPAIPVSPLPHEPTTIHDDSLPPLDEGDLDGFDILDDFFDPSLDLSELLSLPVDPEPIPAGQQQQHQPPPPPPPPQQQQQPLHDVGNDGDVSSVMSEVDFRPYAGCVGKDGRSLSGVGETASWSGATSCCAGGGNKSSENSTPNRPNLNDTPRTTAGWSTTSASEDSDDSSPMSVCSRPDASPAFPPAMGGTSRQSSGDADHYPAATTAAAAAPAATATVKSNASTPILPLTYAPAFDGTGYASSSSTMPLGFGSSQSATFAAAASGAVGQFTQLTAYLKRQCDRNGDLEAERGSGVGSGLGAGGRLGQRSARLLSARGGGEGGGGGGGGGEGGGVVGRVAKKAKKEERLMKNREAANRSRAKRKETMTNLETHVEALSKSLAESRAQCASVAKENASLREQNSFLRGVISEKEKVAIDMPPVVPTPTPRGDSRAASGGAGAGGGGGGGGGVSLSGLSASMACAASAAIGCVAFSSFGGDGVAPYGGRGVGLDAGAELGNMRGGGGGGRTLLSVGDYDDHLPEERSAFAFGGAIQYLLEHGGGRLLKVVLTLEFFLLLLLVVFVVAPWAYKTAMRCAGERSTRGRSRGLARGTRRVREETSSGFYRGLRWLSSGGGGGLTLKRL